MSYSCREEVSRNLSELRVVSLQTLVIQLQINERVPPAENTLMLKSVRTSNYMYIASIMPKCELRLLHVSGYLFISLNELESLTLVYPVF